MRNIALLEYLFMFDPSETWSNLYQFEDDLRKFFTERNMEVTVVKAVEGASGRRIIFIEKKQRIPVSTPKLTTKKISDYLHKFKK